MYLLSCFNNCRSKLAGASQDNSQISSLEKDEDVFVLKHFFAFQVPRSFGAKPISQRPRSFARSSGLLVPLFLTVFPSFFWERAAFKLGWRKISQRWKCEKARRLTRATGGERGFSLQIVQSASQVSECACINSVKRGIRIIWASISLKVQIEPCSSCDQ